MILTVTANPLIDRTLVVPALRSGQIHRATDTFEIAGGKGINVSHMIQTLGHPVHALTFIGGGYGDYLKELLELESIPNTTIRTLSSTRFQVSILDNKMKTHTDILDPAPIVSKSEMDTLLYEIESLLKGSTPIHWVVLSGSGPGGKTRNLYFDTIYLCNKYNVKTLLDSYGDIFKQGLTSKPYCVKPNLNEAELLVGNKLNSKVKILDFISKMFDNGISLPILSLGKDGAIAGFNGKVYEIRPPRIKPVNVTGSGDAFVGALVVYLTQGRSIEDSLRWAVAAGTANALVWKPCGCTFSQIKKILPKVKIREMII